MCTTNTEKLGPPMDRTARSARALPRTERELPRSEVTITIHYFGLIQEVVPRPTERVTLRPGATLADLFAELGARHGPALADALLAPSGEPLPNAVVQLDSRNMLHLQGQATPILRDGTLHVVLTPGFIGGG